MFGEQLMTFKEIVRKILLKLIVFLRKDFDVPRQRIIFSETMRKKSKDMDRDQLGQLIRFHGHSLDKATKCENKSQGRGEERKKILESALQEWKRKGDAFGSDKVWAAEILERYYRWCSGEGKWLEPVHENHVSLNNDIFSVIQQRRSVRFWKKKTVEREKIEKLITAATYAPSSCNRMPWRFFVVENDLNNLAEGDSTNQSILEKAPIKIYVGIDERLYPEVYAPALDAGFASQNIVLAAHALGLGSCVMYQCESVNQETLKTELHIPDYFRIYCVVLLGYPDEIPLMPGRVSIEEVCNFTKDNS